MSTKLVSFIVVSKKSGILSQLAYPVIQTVRFRKPRWLPQAKSKEFYVREPTPIDPEEHAELEQHYKHYRASVRGIRLYLKDHLAKEEAQTIERQASDEDADFAWMAEEALKWNQNVAVNREQRQAEEERKDRERIQAVMEEQAKLRLEKALEAEKLLEVNKEAAANFISKEKLDEAIDKMLDGRSDYNFAITKRGEIIPGEFPDKSANTNNAASS